MPQNQYLQSSDYTNYGVATATTAQVNYASNLIDEYLNKKEGLLYTADINNNPCYMSGLNPTFSCTLSTNIVAGSNVSATITGPAQSLIVGEVGIIDKSNNTIVEPLLLTSVTRVNANTYNITIDTVINSHNIGATIDFGLLIREELDMPSDIPITKLSKCPVIAIMSGYGRYGYGRRGDNNGALVNQSNLLAVYAKFGGPPAWEKWNQVDNNYNMNNFNADTGELWVPAGILLNYYTEVRVFYIAGYTYANLPNAIKQACANIIYNRSQDDGNPSIKSMQAGDTRIDRFANSYIDDDTKKLLDPFKTRMFV